MKIWKSWQKGARAQSRKVKIPIKGTSHGQSEKQKYIKRKVAGKTAKFRPRKSTYGNFLPSLCFLFSDCPRHLPFDRFFKIWRAQGRKTIKGKDVEVEKNIKRNEISQTISKKLFLCVLASLIFPIFKIRFRCAKIVNFRISDSQILTKHRISTKSF